jgi:hypothetical protein
MNASLGNECVALAGNSRGDMRRDEVVPGVQSDDPVAGGQVDRVRHSGSLALKALRRHVRHRSGGVLGHQLINSSSHLLPTGTALRAYQAADDCAGTRSLVLRYSVTKPELTSRSGVDLTDCTRAPIMATAVADEVKQ